MTSRETTIIAIQITLIYFLVTMGILFPIVYSGSLFYIEFALFAAISVATLLFYIVMLFIFSKLLKSITTKLLEHSDKSSAVFSTTAKEFETTTISLLGLYFLVVSSLDFLYDLKLCEEDCAFVLATSVIEFFIGAVFMIIPSKVASLLQKIRGSR